MIRRAEAIRYVPHALVGDYLSLGWLVAVPAFYCHHDEYSAPVVWLCKCEPKEPNNLRAA